MELLCINAIDKRTSANYCSTRSWGRLVIETNHLPYRGYAAENGEGNPLAVDVQVQRWVW